MPNGTYEPFPRKVMTLFLLVDTSSSMSVNGKIYQINEAIREMIPLLKEVSDESSDAEIKLAVMTFSTGCRWVTHDATGQPGPESLEDFYWNDVEAHGPCNMGAAFTELESKLSRRAFLASPAGTYRPAIILLTDGVPNDDWQAGLEKLKHNNYYKAATKVGLCIDEGDSSVLEAFTGNSESVMQVDSSCEDLKSLFCAAAVEALAWNAWKPKPYPLPDFEPDSDPDPNIWGNW